jgi:hypothetical protein
MSNKNLEVALYVSAVLLAIGVFLPLTKLPVYGEVSYNRIADIESYLVIVCALAGPLLLFMNKAKLLILAPLGVWLTLLFPAIKSMFKSDSGGGGFLSKIGDQASSVMTDFASHLFQNVLDFSWGGFVFLLALVVFTVSGVMRWLK